MKRSAVKGNRDRVPDFGYCRVGLRHERRHRRRAQRVREALRVANEANAKASAAAADAAAARAAADAAAEEARKASEKSDRIFQRSLHKLALKPIRFAARPTSPRRNPPRARSSRSERRTSSSC